MIVKKVRNPFKSSSKAVRIHRLADYIDRPENPSPAAPANGLRNGTAGRMAEWADEAQRPFAGPTQEKCIYAGTRGFFTPDRADQKAEMRALAQQAVRSKDPISHYVLIWRAGEQPTPTQIEEAIDLFLDELGLSAHQVFYGLHVDTAHVHLHLMINRVHPETRTLRLPNKGGRDLEAAHRAIARIEHAHGWQREEHGRYRVQVNGEVRREGSTEPTEGPGPACAPEPAAWTGAVDGVGPRSPADRASSAPYPRLHRHRLQPTGGLPPSGCRERASRLRGSGAGDRRLRGNRPGHRPRRAATGHAKVGGVPDRGRCRLPGSVCAAGGGARLHARPSRAARRAPADVRSTGPIIDPMVCRAGRLVGGLWGCPCGAPGGQAPGGVTPGDRLPDGGRHRRMGREPEPRGRPPPKHPDGV